MNEDSRLHPFPEARPPHLPDVLTRLSPWVFVFLAIAAVNLFTALRSTMQVPTIEPASISFGVVTAIRAVVGPLLGVVLFARYRGAWRSLPALAFGLVLLSLDLLESAFSGVITGFLLGASPDETDIFSPAMTAYGVFRGLLGVFAILYIGVGLSIARRRERTRVERPLLAWLVALGVVASVLSVAAAIAISVEMTPVVLVQFGLGIALSLASTIAWAYLAAVTVGGWVAREQPIRAWRLGALAVIILILTPLLTTSFAALVVYAGGPSGLTWIVGFVDAAAWVILLVAFALGLPTLPVASEDDDAATADPPAATPPGSGAG